MLLASRIAAGGLAFIKQRHIGRLHTRFEFCQFLLGVSLDSEVVHTRFAAPGRDCEVNPWILKHPLGVICLDTRRLSAEHFAIKGNARLEVLDVRVNMEAFHTFPL